METAQCHGCAAAFPAEMINKLDAADGFYVVCGNCLIALVGLGLNPDQFANMLAQGHSTEEFFLHSDFYDETGQALQPKF